MLAIHDLSKTYANGVRALDRVTLEIPRGMFGLLGKFWLLSDEIRRRTSVSLTKPALWILFSRPRAHWPFPLSVQCRHVGLPAPSDGRA